MSLELERLPGTYAVCQLPRSGPLPSLKPDQNLYAVLVAKDEITVVCEESLAPEGSKIQPGWACLKLKGPFPFELTGILLAVLSPLASVGVGIFALSTFNTDYVLVSKDSIELTIRTLREAGHVVN